MYPSQEPTKKAWQGMMNRCYTPTNKDYKAIGGAGIRVYDAWHNYDDFVRDMGAKPENSRLARYCDGLDFTPENTYWCAVTNYAVTREYTIWKGIKRRCGIGAKTDRSHTTYIDKGIYMYDDWANDFHAFLTYVGSAPSGQHSIDRIDNNKGYEPGNVRWASKKEQANNRSDNVWIEMDGERKTLQEWCDYYGVPRVLVSSRWSTLFSKSAGKNKKCLQYSMEDELIAEYESVKTAATKTDIKQGTIAKCLSGGNNSAGGFKWRYVK